MHAIRVLVDRADADNPAAELSIAGQQVAGSLAACLEASPVACPVAYLVVACLGACRVASSAGEHFLEDSLRNSVVAYDFRDLERP